MHIKKLKIGVLLLAATSAFSLVPQTTAAADPYNNIVRSFNSLNECEFYRQYKNHGKGACVPYRDTTAWALIESGGSGSTMGF